MHEIINKLKANNFRAYLAEDRAAARELALNLIPPGARVGMGNSLTLRKT